MTTMAILWQTNDGFRSIVALVFEINGIYHHTLSINIILKFRKNIQNYFLLKGEKCHGLICSNAIERQDTLEEQGYSD